MSGFNLDDYVTVAERLEQFTTRFPEGSIQTDIVELSASRVVMRASVYRKPDDDRPSIAHSALGIPGATPYTRGSEIENAETSAIGRAIAFLGFDVKRSVASRDEVASKAGAPAAPKPMDGSLIGTAEVGKVGSGADFELRQTPEGAALAFRLTQGRKGWKVIAHGGMAVALAALKPVGQRVSVWGSMQDETFEKNGRDITFQVVNLERIKGDDFDLPAPEEAATEPLFAPDELADVVA